MQEAYRTGSKLARKLIERDRPDVAHGLTTTQVVVVRGQYDRGETIFDLCEIATTAVDPGQVAGLDLQPDQVLLVNCPGQLPERGLAKVRAFVEQGGLLVTTDWALRHVIETAFPGYVAYGGRATADDVVRVVFEPVEDGFLDGLLDANDDPLWWLEGSSYPIEVLDPARVKVLVSSVEMERKYGKSPTDREARGAEGARRPSSLPSCSPAGGRRATDAGVPAPTAGAIVVAFEVGAGKVYHMTSHFYLQRAETRTARHSSPGTAYLREKGVSLSGFTAEEQEALTRTPLTEVQAAYTSSRAVANLVLTQTERMRQARKR